MHMPAHRERGKHDDEENDDEASENEYNHNQPARWMDGWIDCTRARMHL